MTGHSLTTKCLPVQEYSDNERGSDLTCRQPSNRSETDKGIGTEGQMKEAGVGAGQIQETSGGDAEITTVGEDVSKETIILALTLLRMIWKAIQEEKLEKEWLGQEDERVVLGKDG